MRDMPKNTFKMGERFGTKKWETISGSTNSSITHRQAKGGPGPKLAVSQVMKASCTAARTTLC